MSLYSSSPRLFVKGAHPPNLQCMHCAGVEEAFYYSSRVMTISFHKCAPGFFPGELWKCLNLMFPAAMLPHEPLLSNTVYPLLSCRHWACSPCGQWARQVLHCQCASERWINGQHLYQGVHKVGIVTPGAKLHVYYDMLQCFLRHFRGSYRSPCVWYVRWNSYNVE